ncbi:unnamed protein product [Peniophora sp. CBMAI 1063]|nr:unnamed protein product [Peniophora sp. CBMAI 1063]
MRHCQACGKSEEDVTAGMQACSRCHVASYCDAACQQRHWKRHKQVCRELTDNPPPWYYVHSWNMDRSHHEGHLELITWDCPKEGTGWGHCFKEESNDLRRKFETEFNGNEEKFYEYWPQGFRWTCCGTEGDMNYGCDHHGTGLYACTCDYCRGGKSLPDRIYNKQSAARMGLSLPRGPDPRSRLSMGPPPL